MKIRLKGLALWEKDDYDISSLIYSENNINRNLRAEFLDWMPEKFSYPEVSYLGSTLATDRFLSIITEYTFSGKYPNGQRICNTLDIIYLDDLINVDDEFVSMILDEGIIKMDLDKMSGERDANYARKHLDENDPERVFEQLKKCSEPFDENNWLFKPTFYLKSNRIYLVNIFFEESEFYINLHDIKQKLKVKEW